jgi:hypothetical protein
MIPQFVHTIRGPNVGTGTSSGHRSALMIARLVGAGWFSLQWPGLD